MKANGIVPEFECFDTGIVRSVGLYQNGMFEGPAHISLVMGVASGMPAKPEWLPLLIDEMPPGTHWQVIAIGREEVWPLHRRCVELGGNVRTGLEDTFYLPNGEKARNNGELVEALAKMVREVGREIAESGRGQGILGFGSVMYLGGDAPPPDVRLNLRRAPSAGGGGERLGPH